MPCASILRTREHFRWGFDLLNAAYWLEQALFDLEANNAELKSDLKDLYITSAREIDISGSRKSIIIHVSQ